MGEHCVMCGAAIATGAVACFDCIDYSYDAVGVPREGVVMDTGAERARARQDAERQQYEAELVNTLQVLRARLEVSEAVRAEVEAKCAELERGDSTKLVLGIMAFVAVMTWLLGGHLLAYIMTN